MLTLSFHEMFIYKPWKMWKLCHLHEWLIEGTVSVRIEEYVESNQNPVERTNKCVIINLESFTENVCTYWHSQTKHNSASAFGFITPRICHFVSVWNGAKPQSVFRHNLHLVNVLIHVISGAHHSTFTPHRHYCNVNDEKFKKHSIVFRVLFNLL